MMNELMKVKSCHLHAPWRHFRVIGFFIIGGRDRIGTEKTKKRFKTKEKSIQFEISIIYRPTKTPGLRNEVKVTENDSLIDSSSHESVTGNTVIYRWQKTKKK